MSTAFSAFYPWVLPAVPGCSDLLADQAIRQSAIDFCDRTDIIQTVITADVVAGTQDYVISPPVGMKLARVLSVSWYGQPLVPVSPDLIVGLPLTGVAIGTAAPISGSPAYYYQKTPNVATISLYPIPDTAQLATLVFKVSFKPSLASATLDDILFEDWVEAIANGAVARLMLMPGQPFSSTGLAPTYAQAVAQAVGEARRLKNAGRLPDSLRVMPRSFI